MKSNKEPGYSCEVCRDTGWIFFFAQPNDIQQTGKRCECAKGKRVKVIVNNSGITPEFRKSGFKNFDKTASEAANEMYNKAIDYYRAFESIRGERKNSITLLGQPGVGKTHLLCAVSNCLMAKENVRVYYFPFVDGMQGLRDDFKELSNKKQRMKDVDLLFIDDLFKPAGSPDPTRWEIQEMYDVINYRYMNHKPIMISSELNIESLINVDEALASRIYEMSRDFIVTAKRDIESNYRMR